MTQPYKPNLVTRLYYTYKSLSLPFRRKFFRGFDLEGNKFYESYNPLTPAKYRRTVTYLHDGHYTDNNVTPQWMSWLRHTRTHPPTMEELTGEVARIQATRQNALLVNRQWEEERQRLALQQQDALHAPGTASSATAKEETGASSSSSSSANKNDYIPAPGTRDEKGEWQPESWSPATPPLRR